MLLRNGEVVATECLPDHKDQDLTKKSTISLLRALTILTSTLEPIPAEVYISMRLFFSDHCPDTYQPVGFVDATDEHMYYERYETCSYFQPNYYYFPSASLLVSRSARCILHTTT